MFGRLSLAFDLSLVASLALGLLALPLSARTNEGLADGTHVRLPSLPALARRYGDHLVQVFPLSLEGEEPPAEPPAEQRGTQGATGFFVATKGVVVSVLSQPKRRAKKGEPNLSEAVTVELHNGERRRGRVVRRDDKTGLVVILVTSLQKDAAGFPSLLLRHKSSFNALRTVPVVGDWLVGFGHRKDGEVVPMLGGLRQEGATHAALILDLPSPAGSPVLNANGEVVAVVVQRLGSHQAKAVPVGIVATLLRSIAGTL